MGLSDEEIHKKAIEALVKWPPAKFVSEESKQSYKTGWIDGYQTQISIQDFKAVAWSKLKNKELLMHLDSELMRLKDSAKKAFINTESYQHDRLDYSIDEARFWIANIIKTGFYNTEE